jgi:hypothetical protein
MKSHLAARSGGFLGMSNTLYQAINQTINELLQRENEQDLPQQSNYDALHQLQIDLEGATGEELDLIYDQVCYRVELAEERARNYRLAGV